MNKLTQLVCAAAFLTVSHSASAATPGLGKLPVLGSLLSGGSVSLNTVPVVAGLLGAPGAGSASLYGLPVVGGILRSSSAILPPLTGLPVAGQLPIVGPLIGGNGKLTLEAVPGIGGLLFAGSGGNLFTLSNLPIVGGLVNGSGKLLTPNAVTNILLGGSNGSLLNFGSLSPFDGGLLGNLSNPLSTPLLVSVLRLH